jgi:SAM-dependent methyltransferase
VTDPTDQSAFWDERADAWARHADAMEAFADQFGAFAMDALAPGPGQQVADVGCGPGLTTLALARRVRPGGSAVGIDVSARMVEAARTRATDAGIDNVSFEIGDPGVGPIGAFDRIHSRFGVMFFDDPGAAFANLARSLRPGGRFAATVWAELDANPWMFLPTLLAAGPLEADLTLPGPGEPGPFSLADAVQTVGHLESSGFRDVQVVRREGAWTFDQDTAPDAIGRMIAVGPLGQAWATADEEARSAAVEAVRDGCNDHRLEGGWSLPAAALVLSASAPH